MEKKYIESCKEYMMWWREDVVKFQTPMVESEMTSLFLKYQKDAAYYDKQIVVVAQKFTGVVRIGEFIEDGIKTKRITNLANLQEISKAIYFDPTRRAIKKKNDRSSVVMTIQEKRMNQILT